MKFDRAKFCNGLFTLSDTDSDPNPGMNFRSNNGYSNNWTFRSRWESESESRVHAIGTVSVQYNVAIAFGVRIWVSIWVRLWQCKQAIRRLADRYFYHKTFMNFETYTRFTRWCHLSRMTAIHTPRNHGNGDVSHGSTTVPVHNAI